METYSDFTLLQTGELTILRDGFFSPVYELSDGTYKYGKIITNRTSKADAIIETATENWVVKSELPFKGNRSIYNQSGQNIGMLEFKRLFLTNGFEAQLLSSGYISREWIWKLANFVDPIKIKAAPFSYSNPYTITINNDALKTIQQLPLLLMIGSYLAILDYTNTKGK